jgi:hypothetical protein
MQALCVESRGRKYKRKALTKMQMEQGWEYEKGEADGRYGPESPD